MSTQASDLAIRKSIMVGVPLERTFELFTARIGEWWPLETHSIGGERAETAILEGRAGGRFYERIEGGKEADWANVLDWNPPNGFTLEWKVDPTCLGEVEVRFTPEGDGTRVDLEHRGWGGAVDKRRSYDEGWPQVLDRFVEAVDLWTGPRGQGDQLGSSSR